MISILKKFQKTHKTTNEFQPKKNQIVSTNEVFFFQVILHV